jgi:HSP20 family protein
MVTLNLAHLLSRPFADAPIAIEFYPDGDTYVVRAELPGLDPAREIQLAIIDGQLRIRAEKTRTQHPDAHSDFHYGSFYRGVPLPHGAREESITARYDRGVLEVRIRVEADLHSHEVPIGIDEPAARERT